MTISDVDERPLPLGPGNTTGEQATLVAAATATARIEAELNASRAALSTAQVELAIMARMLVNAESEAAAADARATWLGQLARMFHALPWWMAVLPRSSRRAVLARRLQRRGLFDGERYLRRYPDVAQAGLDPLLHYLAHGMREGREA